MKKTGIYIITMAVMFLGLSCSTIKFAYNRADWLIVSSVSKSACLNDVQEESLEKGVDGLMVWHRKSELPRYVKQMRLVTDALDKGVIDRNTFDLSEVFLKEVRKRIVAETRSFGVEIAMTMSVEQVTCSSEKFEDKQKDTKENFALSPEKYKNKKIKSIRKQIKKWLGSVTEEQEEMIPTMLTSQVNAKKDYEISLRQQTMMYALLKSPNSDEKKMKVELLFTDFDAGLTEDEIAFRKQLEVAFKEKMWKFSQTMTPKQRKKVSKTLREYAEDLEELSQE